MNTNIKYCIFCFKKDSEVAFNREHIIPQNIGGNLYIDEICVNCNSKLGSIIDIQILKFPEILDAFEQLKIPHDKVGIIKNHYKVSAKSDSLEVPAIFQNGKYEIIPKKMPDGSIIFPEETYKSNLEKIVNRDSRVIESDVDNTYLSKEINKIVKKYSSAKPGEKIDGISIGRSLLKRKENFEFIMKPKGAREIERLIAKIYYEFLYFIGGTFVFVKAAELIPIIHLIERGEKNDIFHFSRRKSKFTKPIPTHSLGFIFRETYQELFVSFFGILDFSFMTFIHHKNFWDMHKKHYKYSNIIGIHYEQNLKKGAKNFWFIDSKGKFRNGFVG